MAFQNASQTILGTPSLKNVKPSVDILVSLEKNVIRSLDLVMPFFREKREITLNAPINQSINQSIYCA